jgi:hypothetical protein
MCGLFDVCVRMCVCVCSCVCVCFFFCFFLCVCELCRLCVFFVCICACVYVCAFVCVPIIVALGGEGVPFRQGAWEPLADRSQKLS